MTIIQTSYTVKVGCPGCDRVTTVTVSQRDEPMWQAYAADTTRKCLHKLLDGDLHID